MTSICYITYYVQSIVLNTIHFIILFNPYSNPMRLAGLSCLTDKEIEVQRI